MDTCYSYGVPCIQSLREMSVCRQNKALHKLSHCIRMICTVTCLYILVGMLPRQDRNGSMSLPAQ